MSDLGPEKLKDAFRADLHARWKDRLKELDEQEKTKPRKVNWSRWAIAASVLLLLGCSLWYFLPGAQKAPDLLFAEYFEAPTNILNASTRNLDTTNITDTAFLYYEKADYKAALDAFTKIEAPSDGILFYRAICYLNTEQAEKALEDLNEVKDNRLVKEAQWFISLSYLKLGKKEEAKAFLNTILEDQNHPYAAGARLLKKDL